MVCFSLSNRWRSNGISRLTNHEAITSYYLQANQELPGSILTDLISSFPQSALDRSSQRVVRTKSSLLKKLILDNTFRFPSHPQLPQTVRQFSCLDILMRP